MGGARKEIVDYNAAGVYHCVSRCVRRAHLSGWDKVTGKSFEHRKVWFIERLQLLVDSFSIGVLAFAAMGNHAHVVLRTKPKQVSDWSDDEVVFRWKRIFSGSRKFNGEEVLPDSLEVKALAKDSRKVALWRQRLGDISWFMRCLNEYIARRANHEDKCTGRFWEGRFKCQRILGTGPVFGSMAYTDLNEIRAGMCSSLETSKFTSAYLRLMAVRAKKKVAFLESKAELNCRQRRALKKEQYRLTAADWLEDLEGEGGSPGLDVENYLRLVEEMGMVVRKGKRGVLSERSTTLLQRLDLEVEAWKSDIGEFGTSFHRVVGTPKQISELAKRSGQLRFLGKSASKRFFVSDESQVA